MLFFIILDQSSQPLSQNDVAGTLVSEPVNLDVIKMEPRRIITRGELISLHINDKPPAWDKLLASSPGLEDTTLSRDFCRASN